MLHRRAFCKALATAPATMAAPMLMRSAFADEVSSIVMVSQHGLPYLPLMVMDTLKLVEKHAGKLGLGAKSLVFVIVHSVLWAVALNTHSGFMSVSPTLRMAGQNCGLKGLSYVMLLLVPAAFPSILTGLKIGWAFAWRTLIAAELVFGASSRSGGLGWFIFENRNQLETPSVFAGLLTVIIIGLVVESVIFRSLENATIRRWGMQS